MTVDYSEYAPQFEIYVNGIEDKTLRESVTSIQIRKDLQSSGQFQFQINDEFNVNAKRFVWFDNPSLQPNNKISIKMGYVGRLVELLPEGKIETVTTTGFTQASNPSMTVTGYDGFKEILNEKPKPQDNTANRKLKGSEIIELLKSKYQLAYDSKIDVDIEKTTELPSPVTRNSQNTYGDILADQIQRIGWCYFFTLDKIFYVNPRKNQDPSLTFVWGKNLIEFVPKINTSKITPSIKIRSSHPTSRKHIEVETKKTGIEDRWDSDGITASQLAEKMKKKQRDVEILCTDDKEATIRAHALLNQQGDNLLTGNCKIIGTPELEVGQMIQIDGVGKRFTGKYFVTSVTHTISSNGYLTTFSVRSNVLKEI